MKKKLAIGILSVSLLIPISASAARVAYYGYVLPTLSGNNYTGYHTKGTGDDYIFHELDALQGAPQGANFWADSSGSISQKYNQKVGSDTRINFNGDYSKGNDVRMGMENREYWSTKGYASGWVDFR
ncbi:hypothetical protein [Peribacillus frigoritolerans]|uniref:hypothetical protein n=1 Tax=Peribacillus frigoritolerans TaxID=450367 RepID=UPI0024C128C2|nr:hypothetical protein [Peribacillus frigoritolerans]WHX62361.1 hypothetical protein QNH33_01745 [Peribacillus frigoritolerans]